ncbi:hypothetical protein C0993_001081 [Termitomyces sp. T159_Od127]|nr:hypothetical protein C0993_001081 [Termitomyces sp. T159_Od127]
MSPYIRTIHTDYTARIAPSSSPTKCPPGLPVSGPSLWPAPSYTRRPRRTPPVSYRRPAPPPPPPRTSCAYIKFDPFSDEPEYDAPPVLYRTPASLALSSSPFPSPPPARHRPPPPPPPTLPAPAPAPPPAPAPIDPNARSRLVAGILLNRVHAVGRPMRRRSFDGPREYVKSGLSSVISVEA